MKDMLDMSIMVVVFCYEDFNKFNVNNDMMVRYCLKVYFLFLS